MWSAEDTQTAPTGQLVEAAVSVLAELAGRSPDESPAVCLEWAERLGLGIDRGEAALAAFVAAADRAGEAKAQRFPGTQAWMRTALGMRTGRAGQRLTVARQLDRLPKVAALLRSGGLSYGYASTIAEAVVRLNDEDCAKAEEILLELASKGVTATRVAKAGERIRELIAERDGTEKPPEHARRAERSWWRLSKSLNGSSTINGWFKPELTALVQERLGPLTRPAGPEDGRDPAERLADALEMYLSGGSTHWNATLVVTVDPPDGSAGGAAGGAAGGFASGSAGGAASGLGRGSAAGRAGGPAYGSAGSPASGAADACPGSSAYGLAYDLAGRPAGGPAKGLDDPQQAGDGSESTAGPRVDDRPTAGPSAEAAGDPRRSTSLRVPDWPLEAARVSARLADGTPISPERARMIALNAGVSALILGPDGIPLYLGSKARFVSAGQRRVLEALYETCAFSECDIPARFCETDHTLGWSEHRTTDIDLLAPCCAWHNRAKYRYADQISISRDPRGRWVYTFERRQARQRANAGSPARGP